MKEGEIFLRRNKQMFEKNIDFFSFLKYNIIEIKHIGREKKMKFVNIADMHFDSPFTTLSDKGNLGEKRRIEQRKIFKKVINLTTNLR